MNTTYFNKHEIKNTATTAQLQDLLDTLIRTSNIGKGKEMIAFLEYVHMVEMELSKRKALFPVYRFNRYNKEGDGVM
mgnify:CR=1 FL=1